MGSRRRGIAVAVIITISRFPGHSQDFVYPENIAYAVGGVGQEQFVVIETHYDNPGNIAGVI